MALGSPVQLRLSPDKRMIYEDEAARQGKALATYLRERLEAQDDEQARSAALRAELANGMAELRGIVERGGSSTPGDKTGDPSILLELLILMRAVAGPDRIKMAHAELRRQGLSVWSGREV
ncbi:hypothetical protein AAV32_17475 (plasmid) [Kerstersia gyiorum]|uniref:Mobilization protein n=2 Tax=Kerstersia gyiorum TaxID=206506 RepID=A0A171KMZ7_9BURK|nr:hypothetical protein AAV32_17475 [Kerstersia gyiorum]